MKKVFISGFLSLFLLFSDNIHAKIVTRAAMDVGSAETKVTVADVDTDTNQIVNTWYETYKNVELRQNLAMSKDGCLSKDVEEKLIKVIKQIKRDTEKYTPKEWTAVGTAVFRKAKNGQEFLDRVKTKSDIEIRLIPQQEEGEIGFLSAVAASGLDPKDVIAWDSGSGSFQISTLKDNQVTIYGVEFGFISALETLFINRGKALSTESPNPLNVEEVHELVSKIQSQLSPIPDWLQEHHKKIVCIGAETSLFKIGSIATEKTSFSKNDVWKAIISLCGKTDLELTQFPEPAKAVVALVFLYSVMDHGKMDTISYVRVNGGCEGILIMPKYWHD